MKQIIIDNDGVWITSTGASFNFTDPVSGTVFEPGVRTKIKPNWWTDMQSFLVKDPEEAAALGPVKEPAKDSVVPKK